ncbi:MAG: Lsr2 family DNA-binding protein, partial [Acidimicrobiales bacterium]
VRTWALAAGLTVSDRGRLRPEIWEAYQASEDAAADGV